MPFGIPGGVLNMPGSPYNQQPVLPTILQLNRQIQAGGSQAQQATQDLQAIAALPQFHGFGWQGFVAMLGMMGAGAAAAVLSGPATGAAAGGASATSGSLPAITAGAVPQLPTIPAVGIPATVGGGTAAASSGSILNSIFSRSNLPNLISGGASVAGAILQGRAANNAATLQANAANNAAQLQSQAAQDELAFERQIYGDLQTQNKPFLEAGTNALADIQKLIGEGGELSKPFTAPTAEEVRATPGYQFKLDEAMKQLGRQTRGVTSGATIKAAERFVNDYADSQYNEATNRAMDIFQTNRANRLNPLFQIAGFGPNAVSTSAQAGRAAANANTNILTNQADALGEAGVYGANARAGAGIQTTNALTAALQQIANLAQQRRALTQSSVG